MALLGLSFRSTFKRVKSDSFPGFYPTWSQSFFPLLLAILSFAALGWGHAQAQSREYQLKAAFLFNFAEFVQWPAGSFPNADAPFCIGILGDDPFGAALEATIQGETVNHHKLIIRRGQRLEDLGDCQLIFICKSEEGQMDQILSETDSKPVLTVSEIDRFAEDGGTINFYLQGDKVRFEINPNSARRRGLKISSQLLSLGKIVQPEGGN